MLETALIQNSRLGTTKYSRNIDRAKYVIYLCIRVHVMCRQNNRKNWSVVMSDVCFSDTTALAVMESVA